MMNEVTQNYNTKMSRLSLHSELDGHIFSVMIISTLASLSFVNCFFVQYADSGLDIKNLSNQFVRKVEFAFTSSSQNHFVLHYVEFGGLAGSLNNKSISYDSRTNELSGICHTGEDFFKKQLSESDAKNLELMIDQNNVLFATNNVYSSQGADRINHNLTVINDSGEHHSTWQSNDGIPASLPKIAEEILGIACKN
jgi:hypothetical protein